MQELKYWMQKIQEKRKTTDFQDVLRDLGSWTPLGFTKNNGLISRYPESNRVQVCHYKKFDENRDGLLQYGKDYDFSRSFFENFQSLFQSIPLPNVFHVGNNENCDFVDTAVHSKNSYLSSIVTLGSENVAYSCMIREDCTNIFNSFYVIKGNQNVYFSSHVFDSSYKIFYSRYIKNSTNIWFSSNLTGCSECLFCDDLQNCSYYISNTQYEKEEYFQKKQEILSQKGRFLSWYAEINTLGNNYNSSQCSGNCILDSSHIENGYGVFNMVNGRNLMFSGSEDTGENCYDLIFGGKGTNDCYGVTNFGGNPDNIYIGYNIGYSSHIFYSYGVEHCSFCLGCVGLQNKSYCIFNKQYDKEEWYETVDKIFSQMEQEPHPNPLLRGEGENALGEYFPGSMNPLYFNDTFAYLFGCFSKEEVQKKGYMWRDEEIKVDIPEGAEVVYTTPPQSPSIEGEGDPESSGEQGEFLSNYQGYDAEGKWCINPAIMKKIIQDEKGNYYRIVQMEYDFLMKHGLPLPEIHWVERMRLNFGVS